MVVRRGETVALIDPCSFVAGQHLGRATLEVGLPLDAALDHLGITADEVTTVAISHFHPDHVGGLVAPGATVPRFPHATHTVPARDWRHFVEDDVDGVAHELMEQLGPVREAGLLEMVDADTEIAPGITVLDTPGESPGHLSMALDTGAGAVYYLADLVHFPIEFTHIDWIAVANRPPQQLIESRRRLFNTIPNSGVVVYTHSRFPGWGQLHKLGHDSWEWRYLD